MIKGVLTNISQAEAKTGAPYSVLKIKTKEGMVSVNVWNSRADQFTVFKLVEIDGEKENSQGISCSKACVKQSEVTEEFKTLVNIPISKESWLSFFNTITVGMDEKKVRFLLKQATRLYEPYSKMPAAKQNHHVYPGGLLDHTFQLLNMFKAIKDALPFKVDPFIVIAACLFHDYLKLAEYDPKNYGYRPVMFLKGHVVGSAEVVGELLREEGFESKLILHIQHAILAHHGKLEWGSPVLPATPEAFLVHHLDMLSGHGVIFDDTPDGTKSWALGTTIFHYE